MTAGTVNCDGAMRVRAERAGGDTAMADIVRAVEAAQARAAPVQRLADQVPVQGLADFLNDITRCCYCGGGAGGTCQMPRGSGSTR